MKEALKVFNESEGSAMECELSLKYTFIIGKLDEELRFQIKMKKNRDGKL